jgi:tryptophan synthase alpha subunit
MLTDLKEIEKFLKLCRKQGVESVIFEGLTVKFGDMPSKPTSETQVESDPLAEELTDDQLMFYAVQNTGPV